MRWIVYYHNVNRDRIEEHNVFNHGGFRKDVLKYLIECDTRESFAEKLHSSLFYYYWGKSEWEILVYPWCGSREGKGVKVDVYTQVKNNWDAFLEYTWSQKQLVGYECDGKDGNDG